MVIDNWLLNPDDIDVGILIVNGQKVTILTSSVSNIKTMTEIAEFSIQQTKGVIFIVRVASFTE